MGLFNIVGLPEMKAKKLKSKSWDFHDSVNINKGINLNLKPKKKGHINEEVGKQTCYHSHLNDKLNQTRPDLTLKLNLVKISGERVESSMFYRILISI